MQSSSPASRLASRSCVQSDFPDCASVCRSVVLSASPTWVAVLWVLVLRSGEVCERRVVKMRTCARARAEARVPMRRVRLGAGTGLGGSEGKVVEGERDVERVVIVGRNGECGVLHRADERAFNGLSRGRDAELFIFVQYPHANVYKHNLNPTSRQNQRK